MTQELDHKHECIEGIMTYIDFLGLSSFLKGNTPLSNADAEKINKLNALIYLFEKSLGHHSEFAKQIEEYETEYSGGRWGAISYSDNVSIFISGEESQDPKLKLTYFFNILLAQLAHFQYDSISAWKINGFENFLVRGGITYGYGYISDNIVTGPAHLHAYTIEQSDPYPRIIIDKKIFDIIDKTNLVTNFIIKDCNEIFFIDYFEAFSLNLLHYLKYTREFIMENLKRTDVSILQKYQWTARYFNYHCLRYNLNDLLIPKIEDYEGIFGKISSF